VVFQFGDGRAMTAIKTTVRIRRPPGERRAQFLDCAQALFFTRGYDATTVNDIIERAGLSKGAFYHYFDSKEALLDALTERVAAQIVVDAAPVLEDPDLDALSRLNAFLAQGRQWKIERAPALRAAYTAVLRTDNVMLNQRLIATTAHVVLPVLTGIVREGVREGVFDPPAPEMVAEIVLQMSQARMSVAVEAMARAAEDDLDAAVALLEARLEAEAAVITRLLGVEPGAVRLVEPGFVRAMLRALG
jgi:AcrR family transcriptional regulator